MGTAVTSLIGGALKGMGLKSLGTSIAGQSGLASTWGEIGQFLGKYSLSAGDPEAPQSEVPLPHLGGGGGVYSPQPFRQFRGFNIPTPMARRRRNSTADLINMLASLRGQ